MHAGFLICNPSSHQNPYTDSGKSQNPFSIYSTWAHSPNNGLLTKKAAGPPQTSLKVGGSCTLESGELLQP